MAKVLKFWKEKAGFYKIANASALLKPHQVLIDKILQKSQAPKAHFDSYYLYSIKKMAKLVQSLPASQSHHHSRRGGFLLHNLEVIDGALNRRNTILLPLGSTPEDQSRKKDVWSFGVFVAAIMHDMGKLLSDVEVVLLGWRYNEMGRWSPFVGDMTISKKAKYYQYHYNNKRQYSQHPLNTSILLTQIVHPVALDWLKQEPELWAMLLMSISGRNLEGGVVSEIIKHADSLSVSASLKNPNQESAETGLAPKSLAEKLLDTLRYLTLETNPKINEKGAGIYTTSTDVYYVSKRMLDDIKTQLRKDGQGGIPNDNVRLMDEMLQFKLIIPTGEDKAIWDITLSGGGFKVPQKLTMLRVDINKIYFNEQDKPKPFAGDLFTDDFTDKNKDEIKPTLSAVDTPKTEIKAKNKPVEQAEKSTGYSLPLPPGMNPVGIDKPLAVTVVKDGLNENINSDTNPEAGNLDTSLGGEFLAWLVDSIKQRSIKMNNVGARVHVVNYDNSKALFLVSPVIFKEYSEENWERVQKHFGRAKFNEKTYNDENIWKVQTTTNRTDKAPSKIKGYLLINLKDLGFVNLPSVNQKIELIMPSAKTKL